MAEHDASTGGVIYNYVYSGSRMVARMGSGVINWFVSDRLSNRLVLDASGNVVGRQAHLPFGEDFGESGTQEKHHFTSYERDGESGTDNAMHRQYLAYTGRFNRPDPAGASARMNEPQTWNRYGYVSNMPIDEIDPLGLSGDYPLPCWGLSPGECLCESAPEACYGNHGGPFPGNNNSPPPQWWTGFNTDDMTIINQSLTETINLLNHSDCASGLTSRQFGGRTIDLGQLMGALLTMQAKPEGQDATTHGQFRVFNGETSEHPSIAGHGAGLGGVILGPAGPTADIFLYAGFFNARGDARIAPLPSRAVALIHEAIHLQGFHDGDFREGGFKGSKALNTFIIHSCISPLFNHNDLSIVVQ